MSLITSYIQATAEIANVKILSGPLSRLPRVLLLLIAIIPCVYIFIYGLYATFGPIDLYKDGTENFIAQNPGKELPVVFVLLKFYQYIF